MRHYQTTFGDDWPRDLLDGYESEHHWQDRPATAKQIAALERRGYRPPENVTKGEAGFVLGKPTPKQRRVLEQRGLWENDLTFAQARELMNAIARDEGWGCR
jgi:hypothetical protein